MRRTLLLLFCTAAVGCTRYTARPLDPAQSAATLSTRRLAGRTWTLSQLREEAERHQPEIAVARAQYDTAVAAIRTAGESPNPTVTLSPQIITPYTSWIAGTYGVDFDWTFETAGKRSHRLDVAYSRQHAAAAHVIETTWKVRVAVRKALLDLYSAGQRAKLIAEAIAGQTELLKLMEERMLAGEESRSALTQPRLLLAQLRMQQSQAGKDAALARAALAEALGMSTSGLLGVSFVFAPFERVPVARTPHRRQALTRRADVLAALADYAAAESTLRLEIARQYPDLHLNPGYQLDAGENKWAIGIGLTLPLLNQNQGAIGEAEARRKEAAARFNAVQARVMADCDRAMANVEAARAKMATTSGMLAEQERQLESERRQLAAGAGDRVALLSAQVEHATALTSRLDALVEIHAALGLLEEATQSPLDP